MILCTCKHAHGLHCHPSPISLPGATRADWGYDLELWRNARAATPAEWVAFMRAGPWAS